MNQSPLRFAPVGLLALDPRAFGLVMSIGEAPAREMEILGAAAVVSITGPLEHHKGEGFCDSYEDILRRVTEACASEAKAVVLKVDSPGGLVSGCFGAANALRAKCDAAGKPLLAFVSGSASSAAYALVSQADRVVLGVGSTVGSIGIIDARVDATRQDAAFGLQYAFITSGERKADGNPHLPLTDEELAERQSMVNAFASVFFDLVEQRRPTTAAKIKALQARSLMGQAAVESGLADEVGTFEGLLASVAGEQQTLTQASAEDPIMSARKALEEAAKGDGEEAKKAKRALAAYDKDEEEASTAESEEGDEEEAAEEDDEDEKKKKDEEARAAAAASASSASAPSASALKAIEDEQRRAFLDTRPDLTAAQVAAVQGLPMANVRAIVNAIPKGAKPKHAATVTPGATRGSATPSAEITHMETHAQQMDRVMGTSEYTLGPARKDGNRVVMGEVIPKLATEGK